MSKSVKCDFRGLAMGDSWISPIDSVLTWGPYLYATVSNCDSNFHSVCCSTAIRVLFVAYVVITLCFLICICRSNKHKVIV